MDKTEQIMKTKMLHPNHLRPTVWIMIANAGKHHHFSNPYLQCLSYQSAKQFFSPHLIYIFRFPSNLKQKSQILHFCWPDWKKQTSKIEYIFKHKGHTLKERVQLSLFFWTWIFFVLKTKHYPATTVRNGQRVCVDNIYSYQRTIKMKAYMYAYIEGTTHSRYFEHSKLSMYNINSGEAIPKYTGMIMCGISTWHHATKPEFHVFFKQCMGSKRNPNLNTTVSSVELPPFG